MNKEFYPLIFRPILKERIWGGTKLKELGKPIISENTGESWELSAVENDVSVVANGAFEGKSISALIDSYPEEILGSQVYERFGKQFPLLFKFLDAREDLSIQVHPDDALAAERHNSFGKTEMWYVIDAEPGAKLIVGWKEKSRPEAYVKSLRDKTLLSALNEVPVQEGDVFFLETGTVHALGAGLMIAEIQQTSDITYRIYDFDRTDADGNTRELHVDQALDAINYDLTNTRRPYLKTPDRANEIVNCPYFTTNFIPLREQMDVHKPGNAFTVYMCTEGSFTIIYDNEKYSFAKGDTVLMPACVTDFELRGTASLLEIYIS